MEEEFMLGDLDIQENAVIDLVITQEGGAATQMDPAIVEMSKKYNHDKKVCRKCYATLPPRANKCRKRRCGHWPDIRPRKFAVNAMPLYLQELTNAEKGDAVIG